MVTEKGLKRRKSVFVWLLSSYSRLLYYSDYRDRGLSHKAAWEKSKWRMG